jgi:uncharacterized protein
MRTRIVVALGVVGLSLGPVGCVSLKRTPEARFYVLRALAEPPEAPAPGPGGLVGVLRVRLPGYLDRPQLVTETGGDRVAIDEYSRWAELLPPAVTRTLADNLAILLPESRVVSYPWRASEPVRCRVAVELQVLAPHSDGTVRLEGRWALLPAASARPLVQRPVGLRRGPVPIGKQGPEPGAAVEAMSQLLAELGREIAAGVRALPAEGAGQ